MDGAPGGIGVQQCQRTLNHSCRLRSVSSATGLSIAGSCEIDPRPTITPRSNRTPGAEYSRGWVRGWTEATRVRKCRYVRHRQKIMKKVRARTREALPQCAVGSPMRRCQRLRKLA